MHLGLTCPVKNFQRLFLLKACALFFFTGEQMCSKKRLLTTDVGYKDNKAYWPAFCYQW